MDSLTLDTWTPEGAFLSNTDVIEYKVKGKDGKTRRKRKGLRPDGYFVIIDNRFLTKGEPPIARHLVEVDCSTHSNTKFGQEKAAPGAAYLESLEYETRFGANAGRWLVLTTGERRMRNLMRQTYQEAGSTASYFHFTVFAKISKKNVLTAPIWWQVNKAEPVSLFPY